MEDDAGLSSADAAHLLQDIIGSGAAGAAAMGTGAGSFGGTAEMHTRAVVPIAAGGGPVALHGSMCLVSRADAATVLLCAITERGHALRVVYEVGAPQRRGSGGVTLCAPPP